MIGNKNTSILNNPIPFEALLVKKNAKGTIAMVDIQDPTIADNELSSAKFSTKCICKKIDYIDAYSQNHRQTKSSFSYDGSKRCSNKK